MANRPSVSEIIEAIKAAGPAKPEAEAETESNAAATSPESEASPEGGEAGAEAASASAPSDAPASGSSGRPLTMKEKLAAARGKPAGSEPAAASAPEPTPAAEEPEDEPSTEAEEAAPEPPPVPTGRPLTLQEKIAASRNRPAGAAPAKAKPQKAAAAQGKEKASPTAPAAKRTLPPLEKMSDPRDLAEALRRAGAERAPKPEDGKAKTKPSPKKAAPKVVPPKPTRKEAEARASAEHEPEDQPRPQRRSVLKAMVTSASVWMTVGWATLAGGLGAFTMMFLRFMFPNVLAEPPSTVKVGLPGNYDPEAVNEDYKAEWGFWIVRSAAYDGIDKVYALQSVCTHLGCPPNWLPVDQKFKCPCHGSGFYISGVNFEGPAPRPLERFRVVIADDGQLLVDKRQKYQEELGQWSNPESFVPV